MRTATPAMRRRARRESSREHRASRAAHRLLGRSSRYNEPAGNVASLPLLSGSPLDDRVRRRTTTVHHARVSECRARREADGTVYRGARGTGRPARKDPTERVPPIQRGFNCLHGQRGEGRSENVGALAPARAPTLLARALRDYFLVEFREVSGSLAIPPVSYRRLTNYFRVSAQRLRSQLLEVGLDQMLVRLV